MIRYMKPQKAFILFFLILFLFLEGYSLSTLNAASPVMVKIGVLANEDEAECRKMWQPTIDYLADQLPEYRFKLVPLGFDKIDKQVEENMVDFVICNPAMYVNFEVKYGATRLLTLKGRFLGKTVTKFGGVIFRRKDSPGMKTLADIKGKKFAAVDKNSFGGWQTGLYEFEKSGINPKNDFSLLYFSGSQPQVVYDVKSGKADAGIVRTGTLEKMAERGEININDFYVFPSMQEAKYEYPFKISTGLFPEWAFARTRNTSEETAKKVSEMLLEMHEDSMAAKAANSSGWTICLNYQPVHECLKAIKVPPYESYGTVSYKGALRKLIAPLVAAIAGFLILVIFMFYISKLNRRLKDSIIHNEQESEKMQLMQKEMKDSEERLRLINENSTDIILSLDTNGLFTYISPIWKKLLGSEREDITGMSFIEFIYPGDRGLVKEYFLRGVVSAEQVEGLEFRLRHTNGSLRWFRMNASPIMDADGRVKALAGVARDITESKRAEDEIKAAYKIIANADRYTIDELIRITVNEAERLTGSGIAFFHFVEEGQKTISLQGWSDNTKKVCTATGKGGHYPVDSAGVWVDCIYERKPVIHNDYAGLYRKKGLPDGHVPLIREAVVPVFTGDVIVGIIGVGNKPSDYDERDVNIISLLAKNTWSVIHRKKAETALKESTELFKIIGDSALDAMIVMDSKGNVTLFNPSAEKMFGFTEKEILGKSVHDLLAPERYRKEFNEKFPEFQKTGSGDAVGKMIELVAMNSEGAEFPVEMSLAGFRKAGEWMSVATVRDITKRKQIEDEYKKSEERYRSLVENINDVFYTLDNEGNITYLSPVIERLSKYKVADLIGKSFIPLIYPDDLQGLMESFNRLQEGQMEPSEFRIMDKDGTVIYVSTSSRPVYTDGQITGFTALMSNITERKKAEEALRESEQMFKSTLEDAPDGIYISDLLGNFILGNRRCEEIIGFKREELVGKNFLELNLLPEDEIIKAAGLLQANIEGKPTGPDELNLIRKDGSRVPVEINTSLIKRYGETVALAFVRDITKRKQVEDAFKKSEEKFRTLVDNVPGIVYRCEVNAPWRMIHINDAVLDITGRPAEEFLEGRIKWADVVVPYDLESLEKKVREGVERNISYEMEYRISGSDGGIKWVWEAGKCTYDDNGTPLHIDGVILDVTQRKIIEAELENARDIAEAATRAKSEFLSNMSHEIRTPMNAIIGLTYLALQTGLTVKQREYLTKIHDSAGNLLGIINDILDFSKIEAGRIDLEEVEFSFDSMLAEISNIVSKTAEDKGIEFVFDIDSHIPARLVGDPLRIKQVLINLTGNAIKFTEKGEVVLRAELMKKTVNNGQTNARIKFVVSDTGIGLKPEQIDKLFESFTQADSTITRRYGGTGLGLTISRKLVNLMGGEIEVQSVYGRGTTFSFSLDFNIVKGHGDEFSFPSCIQGFKALVVDDNESVRDIMESYLTRFGFAVTTASNGEQAIKILEEEGKTFKLMLLDWKMPGLDGLQTMEKIKADAKIHDIPSVIMVSGYIDEDDNLFAQEHGVSAFLKKPMSRSDLLDVIMEVLGQKTGKSEEIIRPSIDTGIFERLRGGRVLLVEDNVVNQQVASEILKSAGMTVKIAGNGKKALKALDEETFDIVLMDVQMPEMDGIEATRIIRRDDKYRNLPIIAMTAHAMAGDRERFMEAGMNDHTPKPIDPESFFATLAKWIDKKDTPSGMDMDIVRKKSPVALPEKLEGIDVNDALKRIMGNKALLKDIIIDFCTSFSDAENRIKSLVDSGEIKEAEKLVHNIKGAAGNIGASRLHHVTAEYDDTLRKNQTDSYKKMHNRFAQEMKKVLSNSAILAGPADVHDDKPVYISEKESMKLAMLADALEDQLKECNFESADTFDKIVSIGCKPLEGEIKKLGIAINRFDFEAALGLLREIKKNIDFCKKGDES